MLSDFLMTAIATVQDQFDSPVACENWVLLASETLSEDFKAKASNQDIQEYFFGLIEQERQAVEAGFEPKSWAAAASIKRGRPVGYTPSGNPPMVKKTKSWSLPADAWEWLESQPNQSAAIREAIYAYRQ